MSAFTVSSKPLPTLRYDRRSHDRCMTETPERVDEPATGPVDTLPPPPPAYTEPPHAHRPNRLYQAAAWVAIVAGVMFIVGAVFFTGFALGRHSGVRRRMAPSPRATTPSSNVAADRR